jgi:predicted dehydrogenase
MKRKFRLGSVGLGHRGRAMLKWASTGVDSFEAVATCDQNPDRFYNSVHFFYGGDKGPLKDELPDITFYQDYDEMLEKADLDIVIVDTPATCHAEFCAKALKKGIHVYSDIPSIATLEEADMLWKVQQESSAMLMTGATTCGWGFILALQDLVKRGLLGKPFAMDAEYIHDLRELWEESPWRIPSKENPWYPISYCTHSLGPLLSIIDEDLKMVTCLSTGSHVTDLDCADDLMTATYQTPTGVIVRQTCSFINNCKTGHHSFRIFGTEGYFEHLSSRGSEPARTRFNSNKLYGADKITELPVSFLPKEVEAWSKKNALANFGHGGADSYMMHKFEETLLNGTKQSPCDLRMGLRMTLPGIFAVNSALEGGTPQKIYYPWDSEWKDFSIKGNTLIKKEKTKS